jgi:hypothetical protein
VLLLLLLCLDSDLQSCRCLLLLPPDAADALPSA